MSEYTEPSSSQQDSIEEVEEKVEKKVVGEDPELIKLVDEKDPYLKKQLGEELFKRALLNVRTKGTKELSFDWGVLNALWCASASYSPEGLKESLIDMFELYADYDLNNRLGQRLEYLVDDAGPRGQKIVNYLSQPNVVESIKKAFKELNEKEFSSFLNEEIENAQDPERNNRKKRYIEFLQNKGDNESRRFFSIASYILAKSKNEKSIRFDGGEVDISSDFIDLDLSDEEKERVFQEIWSDSHANSRLKIFREKYGFVLQERHLDFERNSVTIREAYNSYRKNSPERAKQYEDDLGIRARQDGSIEIIGSGSLEQNSSLQSDSREIGERINAEYDDQQMENRDVDKMKKIASRFELSCNSFGNRLFSGRILNIDELDVISPRRTEEVVIFDPLTKKKRRTGTSFAPVYDFSKAKYEDDLRFEKMLSHPAFKEKINGSDTLADIGNGGNLALRVDAAFLKRNGFNGKVIGVDPFNNYNEVSDDNDLHTEAIKKDGLSYLLEQPDNSLNILCSNLDHEIIKKYDYAEALVKEIFRVVPEDGLFICTDSQALDYIAKKVFPYFYEIKDGLSTYIFTKKQIKEIKK